MSAETWRDGQLKSTKLTVNAFPPEHDAILPDEVFLDAPHGRVEMCRGKHTYGKDYWMVYSPNGPEKGEKFAEFETAFAHALRLVRREVEDGE